VADSAGQEAPYRPMRQGPAAVALRLAGASYHEIAEALSLSSARLARAAVEETLAAQAVDPTTREHLRAEEGARLDRLLRGVWAKATDLNHPEHLPAVKVARDLIDRRIRLYGLDAPSEVVVHTPTMLEIDQWVATVTATQLRDLRELEDRSVVDVDEVIEAADATPA
jgi:hypothetical protein